MIAFDKSQILEGVIRQYSVPVLSEWSHDTFLDKESATFTRVIKENLENMVGKTYKSYESSYDAQFGFNSVRKGIRKYWDVIKYYYTSHKPEDVEKIKGIIELKGEELCLIIERYTQQVDRSVILSEVMKDYSLIIEIYEMIFGTQARGEFVDKLSDSAKEIVKLETQESVEVNEEFDDDPSIVTKKIRDYSHSMEA